MVCRFRKGVVCLDRSAASPNQIIERLSSRVRRLQYTGHWSIPVRLTSQKSSRSLSILPEGSLGVRTNDATTAPAPKAPRSNPVRVSGVCKNSRRECWSHVFFESVVSEAIPTEMTSTNKSLSNPRRPRSPLPCVDRTRLLPCRRASR